MVEIDVIYEGELRCRAEHLPSGDTLHTDAPLDNEGRGELFSPTDLVATALGSCLLTILGIMARRHGVDVRGARVRVVKEMSAGAPRRIARLPVTLDVPAGVPDELRGPFERALHACPVMNSLHPDIEKPLTVRWG
jgi:putative redox protein